MADGSDMKSLAAELGLNYFALQYGQHTLQQVGIWEFTDTDNKSVDDSKQSTPGYWLVYIHGGAWRDPRNTHQDFWPSIKHILPEAKPSLGIRGFMSIDYRLSHHPDFPQPPDSTKKDEFRDALHPDHIWDVSSALERLQEKYNINNDYVLIGHSAGATLAFQFVNGAASLGRNIPQPSAIVGISGIYDLIGLSDRFKGSYDFFIKGAFGDERDEWEHASPTRFPGKYGKEWPLGKLALLAWSPEDTLIDEPEIINMSQKLSSDGVRVTVDRTLHGEHDFVWQDGAQLSRLVITALETL